VLAREGISAMVLYPNLWFAEEAGLRLYHLCASQLPKELLAGEWTFAASAFPEADLDGKEYLRRLSTLHASVPGYHRGPEGAGRLAEDLRALRCAASAFVDRAARRVLARGARIVGCTSTFEQHTASLALLRRIREIDPSVVTLLGGANCEGEMGRATHRCFPWVDYAVSGEADALVADLCRLILEHGREVPPEKLPGGVFGPAHRFGAGASGVAPRPIFRELDGLPVPDFWEYFRVLADSRVASAIRPGLPFETSRGCWWGAVRHCTFCGLNGSSMAFRSKSPRRVVEEVRELEARHGLSRFEAVDNILDMGYFRTVLPELAADGDGRRFFYEIKSNLRREQVEGLRQAGVIWVQPGIESLSTPVLDLMDKGVQAWQNLQLLKWCRELGVRLSWNLLWDFPGEEDAWYEEMASWLPALEHLQPPGGAIRVRFDRFSPYHQRPRDFGLTLRPVPAMAFVYPLPEEDLRDLAYYFAAEGRPDAFAGTGGDPLAGRPGVHAVRSILGRWRQTFWSGPPRLTVEEEGEALRIRDGRSCAPEPEVRLTGLEREVYLACEDAPLEERLGSRLTERNGVEVSPETVTAAVRSLRRRLLVVAVDCRLVSLGLRGGLPPLPDLREFPGGLVEEGPWQWA
ncbi:MAG TPA: RiPP maturation radical SAM C-methyltransferase, partial [Thermoanaerobaculia bacterium]|nr:RiPP maturation radical SAM C-methyltransferase [Thermoanaerobaculia bacterium]